MTLVQNFSEFYNILKTHANIPNTVPALREYILLVEAFKSTCSCNRGGEKQRLKNECENRYRLLITNEVTNNINLFHSSLGANHIRFLYNNAVIKDFNL
jgi:hypothetical protein